MHTHEWIQGFYANTSEALGFGDTVSCEDFMWKMGNNLGKTNDQNYHIAIQPPVPHL